MSGFTGDALAENAKTPFAKPEIFRKLADDLFSVGAMVSFLSSSSCLLPYLGFRSILCSS